MREGERYVPFNHVIQKTMLRLGLGFCNSRSWYIIYCSVVTCHTWLPQFLSAVLCDASWKLATAGEMFNKYSQILLMAVFQSLWSWIFHISPSQKKRGWAGVFPWQLIWRHVEQSRGGLCCPWYLWEAPEGAGWAFLEHEERKRVLPGGWRCCRSSGLECAVSRRIS